MRNILSASLIVAVAMAALGVPPHPVEAASNSSVYWGVYVMGAPANTSLMDAVEAGVGKKAALEMLGQSWSSGGVSQPFPTSYMQTIRNRGTIPVLDWASQDLCCGTAQANYQLADITGGRYDAYITQWAQASRAWGKPYFLRFDAEMNGWWRPWSEQLNGNQPGDFVRAWRHVVDIFRAQGATNATWVWCPNIVGPRSTPMSGLYPGDNYVDWTCMDGYNFGLDRNNQWQWFNQVFAGSSYNGGYNTYQLLQAQAPTKPIMIGETASSETGGSKVAWITDMLTTQLPKNFPKVKAFIWFDWNENDPGLHWPINTSASAQSAFAAGIASSYYATNEFAGLSGSPIQALPGPTSAASAPPPTSGPTVTLKPVADTYASRSASSSTAGGTSTELRSDLTGSDTTFMRFDLSSVAGKTITSVTLRVKSGPEGWAGSSTAQNVFWVADTGWWEQYLSYTNSVAVSSIKLGSLTPTQLNTWYDTPLSTSWVQQFAGRLMSLAIQGAGSDVFIMDARESGANAPQLVVTTK